MPYVKTREPDKDEFARLLKAAMGDRTMSAFAELCGVSPSTVLRVLNKSNKGASSQAFMEAIACNAAPGSGVTHEAILEANGFTPLRNTFHAETTAAENERAVYNVLLKELLVRGAELRMGDTRFRVSKNLKVAPDILILTDIFGGGRKLWMMEVLPPYKVSMEDPSKAWAMRARQKTFQTISRFSFLAMQGVDWQVPAQFSIVTSEEPVYRALVDEFSETKVPAKMSLIFVDTECRAVKDEFFLPQADGSGIPESYFRRVPPTGDPAVPVEDYDEDVN